ncbi:prolyl 4-hydroxylase subunit alpha-2-like [Haliotis cracherodii]|uniref:prolyl 4-hydroxylase subunit alpha-2-like n=1 Tax=Haliotis cracherodii TaxID=6455 RepID=UPI0039ECEBFF
MACCPVLLCVVWSGLAVVGADVYTSSAQLQKLMDTERQLLLFLEKLYTRFSEDDPAHRGTLASVQLDLQALPMTSSVRHPLDAVVGLRRYHGYVGKYLQLLPDTMATRVADNLRRFGTSLPDTAQVTGSQHGLLRLQSTYKLTTGMLMTSSLFNVSARDCIAIATVAERAGLKTLASDWFDVASGLPALKHQTSQSVTRGNTHQHQPSEKDPKGNLLSEDSLQDEEFDELCRQHMNTSTLGYTTTTAVCRHVTADVPFMRWRLEELHDDPHIVLFHDVIADWEADVFIRLASGMLERATTGQSPGQGSLSEARTSKVAWLWDNHTHTVARVSRRVADITGLNTDFRDSATFAEPFQVVNYGIGGHYSPHYDFYVNQDNVKTSRGFSSNSGDRMATFMFYLSDVEEGGATVFPELGIGAPPVKNAALFWYNFLPDGSPDPRTRHGGCPVLYGHKWVANKWIREMSGAMTRSCTPAMSPTRNLT